MSRFLTFLSGGEDCTHFVQSSSVKSKPGPHILILAPLFPPFKGAAASRLYSFAKYWSDLTQVTVLSPYSGDASMQGYDLIKFPLARWRAEPLKIPFTFSKLLTLARRLKPDVVLASIPPVWSLLEGYLLAWRLEVPLILDVRDLPEADVRNYRISFIRRAVHSLQVAIARNLGRRASRVVCVSDWFIKELKEFLDYPSRRLFVIRNGSESELFKKALCVKKKFDVVYSGTLIFMRNPRGILHYLRSLADFHPSLRVLLISNLNHTIGESFLAEIKGSGFSESIEVIPPHPPEELPELLGSARLGLNSLLSGYPAYRGAIGAKEYEYLAAGLPVVGLMDPEYYIESGRLIVGNEAGIMSQNPKQLAQETAALLKDPARLRRISKRAREVGKLYDRKRLAEEYYYKVILPAWEEFNARKLGGR